MMGISVIVCVYNTCRFLQRCLDSLLSQTFQDFEILLLDDGSTDNSGKICDEYAANDNRIKVFHHKNHGVAWERQFGIDNAMGEYSIHVDSDDWVEPDMLEELYIEAKRMDADVVICDYFEDNGTERKRVVQKPKSLVAEDVATEMFQRLHGSLCNKLVRQACYKEWNIHVSNIMLCEDLYVTISLMLHGAKVSYVPKAFYHYCRDENNLGLTRAMNPKVGIYAYNMNIEFRKLLESYPQYWKLYVKESMPWQSYLVLYYGSVSSIKYKEAYSEIASNPIHSNGERITHLALKHYLLVRVIMIMRKMMSKFLRYVRA